MMRVFSIGNNFIFYRDSNTVRSIFKYSSPSVLKCLCADLTTHLLGRSGKFLDPFVFAREIKIFLVPAGVETSLKGFNSLVFTKGRSYDNLFYFGLINSGYVMIIIRIFKY